jgi:hypothetical protein
MEYNFRVINSIYNSGRILLFVKNDGPNIDLTSGDTKAGTPYKVFQFFIIPGLYPRYILAK